MGSTQHDPARPRLKPSADVSIVDGCVQTSWDGRLTLSANHENPEAAMRRRPPRP